MTKKQRRRLNRSQPAIRHGIETMAMTAGMPLAALITLNHRLPILARTMVGADGSDGKEVERMTAEKVSTAGQMALAMGGAMAAGQQAIIRYGTEQASANNVFLGSGWLRPDQVLAFTQESAGRFNALLQALGDIGSRSVAGSLRPAHRKVTANAKRLSNRLQRGR